MKLIFIYGHPASGKLTVAKVLAAKTGLALFHNHLIVDAVSAVFPFGSSEFIRLREAYWMETFRSTAKQDQSLIFTFAPEPTVAPDFPARVEKTVAASGGGVSFIALKVGIAEQERRLIETSRSAFGKLRSIDVLRRHRQDFERSMDAMPKPELTIDTGRFTPEQAAAHIMAALQL